MASTSIAPNTVGELVVQATTVLKGMWRFRWIGLIAAWIAGIVGVAMALRVPNQFEATARIYVDTQSILKPLMSGLAIQPNIDQQIAMLSRTLISRPNVEKLVRMADLDLKTTSKADQDAQVETLMRTLQIGGNGRDNLYTLAYRAEEPERAKRVVQSLVSIFIDSRLSASRNDADQAKVFISEQIKAYEAKLEAAEARLKEFRLRNIDLFNAEGQDSAARIGDIGAQLAQAQLELREAETARDATKQQLLAERSGTATTSSTQSLLQESALTVSTPEIDARIDGQRRQLDQLLQRFTEQHPDVINTRRLIRDLEEQKKKEVAELRKLAFAAPTGGAGAGSPAAQELSRMLAAAEVQVAALRARVGEYQARYARAKDSMKTAPQLEAEAAQLNRDYAINKRNYEDLVSRRQSATMSGDLDAAAGLADFRLIDPPRVTPKPVSPNRGALLGMALAAALGAGLFVAFAAGQLRPAFHKASELREKINLPILGVVSMILSDADRRRERADKLRFGVASGALLGAFLVVLVATTIVPKS